MPPTIESLQKENEELKRLDAIKSDWISISAHQLRTSLSAIKWILKMFIDKDFGELTSEQVSFLQKAFESNERMIKLVSEMLSLNNMTGTNLQFNFTPNDLSNLIDETVFDFRGESFKDGIELIFLKSPKPIPVFSFDLEKIRVVIQNLIENALKYSKSGSRVLITLRLVNEKTAELSVKDNGIGVPVEQQAQIFTKSFRASNAKEKDPVGSGFGLYTAKHIIEAHQGKIWFESESGEGTTFYISLPLSRSI